MWHTGVEHFPQTKLNNRHTLLLCCWTGSFDIWFLRKRINPDQLLGVLAFTAIIAAFFATSLCRATIFTEIDEKITSRTGLRLYVCTYTVCPQCLDIQQI